MEGGATRPRAQAAGRRVGTRPGFEPLLPDRDPSLLGTPASLLERVRVGRKSPWEWNTWRAPARWPPSRPRASSLTAPVSPGPDPCPSPRLCATFPRLFATWRLGWFGQQEALPSQGREKPRDVSPRPQLRVSCRVPNGNRAGLRPRPLWAAPSQAL